jgi:hypothetical protein
MTSVNWAWKLLLTTSAGNGSHRVARRIAQGDPAVGFPTIAGHSGTDTVTGSPPSWSPQTLPPLKVSDGTLNYDFAFWSVFGGSTGGVPIGGTVSRDRGVTAAVGEDGNANATAYYVWDFGSGPGANAVLIDAFDKDTGFIPDPFVDVIPDDGLGHTDKKSLWWKANDGYLKTEDPGADITRDETLRAFDTTESAQRRFIRWMEIEGLTSPTQNGPTISGNDLAVMPACRVVAFAVYESLAKQPMKIPDVPRTGGIWVSPGVMVDAGGWGIPFGGGPPVPIGPWTGRAMLGASLANSAAAMSPELRERALGLAADQLKLAAEEVRRQMRHGK